MQVGEPDSDHDPHCDQDSRQDAEDRTTAKQTSSSFSDNVMLAKKTEG